MEMEIIVPIVIVFIICLQIVFFIKNLVLMNEYKNIFKCDTPWELERDFETDYVTGIKGKGNKVFESIKESINKYLRSHTGSVIDFHLLIDIVILWKMILIPKLLHLYIVAWLVQWQVLFWDWFH